MHLSSWLICLSVFLRNVMLHQSSSSPRNKTILFLVSKSAVMSAVNGLKVGITSVNEGESKLLVP